MLPKAQGYVTAQFGKNHRGDRDEGRPTARGLDESFGNLYDLNAEAEAENPDQRMRGGDQLRPPGVTSGHPRQSIEHGGLFSGIEDWPGLASVHPESGVPTAHDACPARRIKLSIAHGQGTRAIAAGVADQRDPHSGTTMIAMTMLASSKASRMALRVSTVRSPQACSSVGVNIGAPRPSGDWRTIEGALVAEGGVGANVPSPPLAGTQQPLSMIASRDRSLPGSVIRRHDAWMNA